MEATAKKRKLNISPRKVRLVAKPIRNISAEKALAILQHIPNRSAPILATTLRSAIANLEYKQQATKTDPSQVYIKEILVDKGKTEKRIKPAPRGIAHPIRKHRSHITITVVQQESPKKKNQKQKTLKQNHGSKSKSNSQ